MRDSYIGSSSFPLSYSNYKFIISFSIFNRMAFFDSDFISIFLSKFPHFYQDNLVELQKFTFHSRSFSY
jgi:hypothetical protein